MASEQRAAGAAGARLFELTVLTMDRLVLKRSVYGLVIPAANGYMGVQPGHVPYLATLVRGNLLLQETPQSEPSPVGVVTGGFVEVGRGRVTVFADAVEGVAEEPKEE